MGAAGSSTNAADASNVGTSVAPEGRTSLPGAPQIQPKHNSSTRRRDSDEQSGPSSKRRRPSSATNVGAPALTGSASAPLLIRTTASTNATKPLQRTSEPEIALRSNDNDHVSTLTQNAHLEHDPNPPPVDMVTTLHEGLVSFQVPADLPHAAVQAAATLASEGDLCEGWRVAPDAPLSDLQREQNRREINRAIMRLQPLTRSDSFGTRTDKDDHLFATLRASVRILEPEDNVVDFVQGAKAAKFRARRRAAQNGRPEGRLVMPVSKKRRRSSEDVGGGRSKSNVYSIAQAVGDSPLIGEGRSGQQRTLHGLSDTWAGAMKEGWE